MRSVRAWASVSRARRSALRPLAPVYTRALKLRRTFFTSPAWAAAANREPVQQLLDLLRTSEHTAADRVWALYVEALRERPQELSDGSVRVPRTLSAAEHREVLHALVPHAAPYNTYLLERARLRSLRTRAQRKDGASDVPIDLSTPQELAPPAPRVPLTASDARVYLSRVQALLQNMHAEPGAVRVSDYHTALEALAYGGHFPEMKVLLDEMRARCASEPALTPNSDTYNVLFRGLFVHAQREMQALQRAYGYVLNPTMHGRKRARSTAGDGDAVKAVQHFAQQTAREATSLIQEMQQRAVRPSTHTLDIAARVLRITGQLPALLALLRTGFGVDVVTPDADRGEPVHPCKPTTQTLNTVLMALGEHANVSNMVSAYESMTQALPVGGDEASAEAADTDAGALVRRARTSDVRSVPPNAKTFSILLKHACTAADTLFLAAALVPRRRSLLSRMTSLDEPVGFSTQHDLHTEIGRRMRGYYMSVARYVLDDCVDRYAAQVALLCRALQIDAPGLDASADEVGAAVTEARCAWKDMDGVDAPLRAMPLAHVEAAEEAAAARVTFVPPSVGVSLEMVYPVVSLASRRRASTQLVWMRTRLDRVLLLRAIEANAARAAAAAHAETAPALAASLTAHAARVERDMDALQWLRFERIPARLAAVRTFTHARNTRRAANPLP
ncbi:hypothetical protein MBRA1_000522 [Malassezia brasiliensis]|uniref:Uncharacterized protein n=1 Tax=Malassezia brasiliensis TaxID=1821822 RepID=A0AAF0DSE2_9BASI|nr:hypothetical protein MBRA1_000522 [Malassezia brasiliensis]